MSLRWLLCLHAAATLFMVGLIWFVQVVHYPLFADVARLSGQGPFASYEARHTALTTLVVGPPMLLELICAGLLLFLRPQGLPAWSLWLAAALLAVIWLSTALLQVPRHGDLSVGFDAAAHRALVVTNWLRTVAWSARGGLALWWLARLIRCTPDIPR
jgi:hypothetical protein